MLLERAYCVWSIIWLYNAFFLCIFALSTVSPKIFIDMHMFVFNVLNKKVFHRITGFLFKLEMCPWDTDVPLLPNSCT